MKLTPKHAAATEGRTIHPTRVMPPNGRILKSVEYNSKLGKKHKTIKIGPWKGMPMFSVTLEERKTCPSDCFRWFECFGNGMAFAHRFEHGPELIKGLDQELSDNALLYPEGFVVRTHILGDFYSVKYVNAWRGWLDVHPKLFIFGYSARLHGAIHNAIRRVRHAHKDRFWVRFSTNASYDVNDPLAIYAADGSHEGPSFQCPEQTEKTESCLTCGLCWATKKTVRFEDHDKLRKRTTDKKH